MLSKVLTISAAVAAAFAGGATASSQGPGEAVAGGRPPLASARVAECLRGPAPESRLAVFRGTMRRVPGTDRMAMRFKLQERVGEGRYRTVKAPGLGVWHKSRPGVRRFAYRQRVLALAEGSAYRTIVSFRWYDAGEGVLRRARRRSPACRQPGLLANLRVLRITGGRPIIGFPGAYRYAVHVVNRGRVPAQDFDVDFAVDGETAGMHEVNALAPGESRRLLFSGPACGRTVTAVADRADTVREVSEADNSLTSSCPSLP